MSESFQLKVPETITIPEGYGIIPVIAKTPVPTVHPEDPNHPIRVFDTETEGNIPEIVMASRSLFSKPIGINHTLNIPNALVANADWNFKDKVVEALLMLPNKIIDLIRQKKIEKVSVDYIWDSVVKSEGKSLFKGLKFIGISLLHGIGAGDPNAKILFESEAGRAVMDLSVKCSLCEKLSQITNLKAEGKTDEARQLAEQIRTALGEPFADYADWDACIQDCQQHHKDVTDCNAWCGAIKAQTEMSIFSESLAEAVEIAKLKKEVETKTTELATKDKRIGELETAVSNTNKANEDLKNSREKDIEDAKKEAVNATKTTVLAEITKIIPEAGIEANIIGKTVFGKRLCENIKQVKRKVEEIGASGQDKATA